MLQSSLFWVVVAALFIGVAVIVIVSLRLTNTWSKRKRSQARFSLATSAQFDDYAKDYKSAKEKLSKLWHVIEIIHDVSPYGGALGPAGMPQEITFEQAFECVRLIRAAKDGDIAVVIHTMGGFSFPADMIAKALVAHKGKKVALIPYAAMSGGTVIALAADKIQMGSAAVLGPIDTQHWGLPLSAYEYLKSVKSPDHINDMLLMQSYQAEKFEKTALERAKKSLNPAHGKGVVEVLMTSGRSHSDSISAAEAKDMGIKVDQKECPKDAYDLVDAKLKMSELEVAGLVRRQLGLASAQLAEKSLLRFSQYG